MEFHLNRQRDAALRTEEAKSIAAALYGEVLLLRKEVARIAKIVSRIENSPDRKFDKHFIEANRLSEPVLYKALAPKIGLLSSDLVIAFTEFHKNFEEVRTWLPLMVEQPDRKFTYSPLAVLRPARDAVLNIVPALRKIESMVGIASPAVDPEMGLAEDIIEQEEELFEIRKLV